MTSSISPQVPGTVIDAMAGAVLVKSVSTAAAGTFALFSVVGGRILVLELFGVPTVQVGATATTAKIQATPTSGAASDLSTTVAIASLPVGRHLSVPGGSITTLRTGAGEGGVTGIASPGLIVTPGSIELVLAGSSGAGTMSWTLLYLPLEVGAAAAVAA